ncbi:MAG: DUF4333 domain-containing protein [Oscillatoriales cyanobacterium C42_A2020_001]|nr:DUF4333 domain-containing protein [Leptolyngbyaceae cyanobacterium C42_A2020_001]
MNLSYALKSGACCLVILAAGCQATPPSPTPSPSVQASANPVVSPFPTPPAKSATVKTFEKRLRGHLIKKAGIPIQTVSCPAQVDVKTQAPFFCEATTEGKTFTVVINPKSNTTTDKSELRWSTKGLLVLPKLEQTIQQGIQKQFRLDVKANCGGKVRVAKPGETFQCKVTDSRGQTKPVTVRVDDEQGNVTWRL